ncbi:MAG: choice-of-anchor I family protein [Pigmentiphaga sp.]|uniref:choice-of-anchor I family protein n=1 Tax=Pigmentiphaga sp. TaxID=1977564 RepID=UPI00299F9291|nr:choice-of-anchor I family protein [Pigmentiphaga sp.]MDX3905482.1 choice-of-anchor I family protein [Pigmentiphaga sp.]
MTSALPSLHRTRLARALCALAFVLPLAACLGDGDDGPSSSTPPAPPPAVEPTPKTISLKLLGRYSAGEFNVSAAEIPAYDAASKRGFIVNARNGVVDVLDLNDPANPKHIGTLDASAIAADAEINSIAVHDGIVAVAIQAAEKTAPGYAAFYRADTLALLGQVGVGALPDMLTFTPDGKTVLVANEGEPSDDYQTDPVGSISIIDISDPASPVARVADFSAWNGKEAQLREQGVRIYGPNASAAQDFEPEYIAVAPDGKTAWATLQENNALARIDIAAATVTDILPLGYKDHGQDANALDASDEPAKIDIRAFPGVRGMYLPDAIAAYAAGGKTYLVTANEGDARAWGEDNDAYWAGDASKGFVEEFRVKHLVHANGFARRRGDDLPPQLDALAAGALLNPATFAYCGATAGDPGACRDDDILGRLQISWTLGYRKDAFGNPVRFNAQGLEDANGDRVMYDHLYAYGGRSFSIWDENGQLVWDSGAQFERLLASDDCKLGPDRDIPCADYFNSGHDEAGTLDSRSDAKGPEPEGVEIGVMGSKTFAFVGLERMGGVMVYDITDPLAPAFVDYFNTRADWADEPSDDNLSTMGDLGPEGLKFVPADQSPTQQPLLIVGHEVSGTTAVYEVSRVLE